jgi:Flp pilus assembly protein CpaB
VKRSNRLVILVGVLLAVLAFVAIVILLNQDRSTGPEAEEEVTETVLVATEDIDIGEAVTPDKVRAEEVDPEAVLPTPLRSVSQVQGQAALFAVPADAQLTAEVIGAEAGTDISRMLQPGEKAIAFQVDPATGLDFLVQPGDSIDIVLSEQISVLQETADSIANEDPEAPPRFEEVTGLDDQRTVKAVLQDKRVLYVSGTKAIQPEPQDTNGDGVINEQDQQPEQAVLDSIIVIFAGTAQDAEVIKFAQNDFTELGSLTAIIRHADDDELEPTLGITLDQLVEEFGLRIPGIVEQLNEETTPTP